MKKVFKLRLWEDRTGIKDVSDRLFFYAVPLIWYEYLKIAPIEVSKTEFKLGPSSGVSIRHWVVRKSAIHEHLYFACSVFESLWFGC